MATLEEAETAEIEARIGPVGLDASSQPDRLFAAVERLGSPSLAALEVLTIRYGEMVSSPAVYKADGQGSASHAANFAPMLGLITSLRQEILGNTDVSPTDAGEALLNQAGAIAAPGGSIESFGVTAKNSRPG